MVLLSRLEQYLTWHGPAPRSFIYKSRLRSHISVLGEKRKASQRNCLWVQLCTVHTAEGFKGLLNLVSKLPCPHHAIPCVCTPILLSQEVCAGAAALSAAGGILGGYWDPGQCSTCEPRAELCGHQLFLQVLISPGVCVCIYRETWLIFKLSHFKSRDGPEKFESYFGI